MSIAISQDLLLQPSSQGLRLVLRSPVVPTGPGKALHDTQRLTFASLYGAAIVKTLVALFLSTYATASFAQSTPSASASSAGCGDTKVKFDVKTNRSQHPFSKPDSGKSLVFLLQDDSSFLSAPKPTTRFGLDGNWAGATQSNAYFYLSLDPGEHHLCAEWQSFVGFATGPKSAAAHFTAEAGSAYFFIVRDHFVENHGPAHMTLSPVDSDEAQLLMSKFGFSTSHPRK